MSETEKKLLDRLVKEKQSRFNELASEMKLTDEELADYDMKTVEGLDAGIQSLRIMKGRANAWKEAVPTNEKGFFHPAARTNTVKPQPQKASEEKPQPAIRFNMEQLLDPRLEPDLPGDLEEGNNEGTILRVYAYTDINGNPRFNQNGFKV